MSILPRASVCLGVLALFFAATFAAYGPTVGSDFVSWDDMGLISQNPDVQHPGFASVRHVFSSYDPELYIPVTFLSYQMNHVVCGNSPPCYHFTDTVIHTLNAALVALVLYLLFGEAWIAIGLGLLFALHPLNTEAVAWASARKDTLSTLFFLSSLVSYIAWRSEPKKRWYWLSLLLFALGLLSKVMILTLPVVLLLLDYAERRTDWKKMLLEKVPYFVLSVVFGIVALFGKSTILVASSTSDKVLMAAKSTVFYLVKFFLPADLSVMYPYTEPIRLTSTDFAIPVLLVTLLAGAVLFLVRKDRRWPVTGLLFFLLTLAPTFINFAKGGDVYYASDRYAYVPMIGLLVFLADILRTWLRAPERREQKEIRSRTMLGAFAVILALAAFGAHVQARTWSTSITLYDHVLSIHPNARAAENNLGMEYLQIGRFDDAVAAFDRSLLIRKDPRTMVNRAAALSAKGDTEAATKEYLSAIALAPDLPDAYYGIGNIFFKQDKLTDAETWYRKALEVKPDYTNALNNLGGVQLRLKEWDKAIETLTASVRYQPEFASSYYNLGWAYENKDRFTDAEAMYAKAAELSPEDPDILSSLARLLYRRKATDEAAALLRRALEIDSSNATAIDVILQMRRDGVAK